VAKADFPWGTDGYRDPQTHFIDNVVYNGKQPNNYLKKFNIGLKGTEKIKGSKVSTK